MRLSHDDLVLYLQCLNEVLRGFTIENFEQTLEVSRSELAREDARLREIESATRIGNPIPDVCVRSKVIRATMDELGESEFATRTGYELTEAEEFLNRLERSL
jgi:hypothetical protein